MASTLRQIFDSGERELSALPGGGGGAGGYIDENHFIWDTPRPGHLLQVPCQSPLGGIQRLDRGGLKPSKIPEEVGTAF